MPSRFLHVFPRVALPISVAVFLVLTAPLVVSLSISPDHMVAPRPDLSPLSRIIVEHFRLFALAWWLYSLAAIAASAGLIRRRLWGHRAWVVLLSLTLLWSLSVTASEVVNVTLLHTPLDEFGDRPSESLLGALFAVPTSLCIGALVIFLLRKLLLTRRELGPGRGES